MKPFYVGQEVVANCDQPGGAFKKGDEFTVTSVQWVCCSWLIGVGLGLPIGGTLRCDKCGHVIGYNEWIFYASRFSPKIQISGFVSMKELAEKQLETIGAN